MRLAQLTATAHPDGNRIDLSWVNPDPEAFPGVRVVRRAGSHPLSPEPASAADGVVVVDVEPPPAGTAADPDPDGSRRDRVADTGVPAGSGLPGETVFYYALFPYRGDPRDYQVDPRNRTAAMATAAYDLGGLMYRLLPAVYRRFDAEQGQLRRFLELPGGELDRLYSEARAVLGLHDVDRVDGRLLPLLAAWIGWRSDTRLEVDAQRGEVRNAPAVYQAVGLVPTVEATVKRVVGWESRAKEFVHNVFVTNRPERLNLWTRRRGPDGTWSEPDPPAPLSLDYAYEGRPAIARDADGTAWLLYHTARRASWQVWFKTLTGDTWAPSQPLTARSELQRHPAVAAQGATLWTFWSAYDAAGRSWRIDLRTHRRDRPEPWSPVEPLDLGDPAERRDPVALADDTGGLWLFWLQRVGPAWRLTHNRHDGSAWQLDPSPGFPPAGDADPRVEGDVFAALCPTGAGPRVVVFWARREPAGTAGQTRWTVAHRQLDPATGDWSEVGLLPKADPGDHDREPAAIAAGDGRLEVFWSSNREGSWAVWRATLDLDAVPPAWDTPERLSQSPYSERAPLAFVDDDATVLLLRGNRSLTRGSQVYRATRTVDERYAGSTTVDTRNQAKLALRGSFEDFGTYLHDAGGAGGPGGQDWYRRDTVGLYLEPDTADPQEVQRGLARLERVLGEFLAATDRAVLITPP